MRWQTESVMQHKEWFYRMWLSKGFTVVDQCKSFCISTRTAIIKLMLIEILRKIALSPSQ